MEPPSRNKVIMIIAVILLVSGAGYYYATHEDTEEKTDPTGELNIIDGREVYINHRLGDNRFQTYINGSWEDVLLKGVNMGISKPGHYPGESAITRDEYRRWLDMIGDMNANAIRIYTYHPPAFYQALRDYNRNNPDPIYLFHGIWMTEEKLTQKSNAWDYNIVDEMRIGIERTIDIINGNITLGREPGRPSGRFRYDVSPYVMGIIFGIEWDPVMVANTNVMNPNSVQFEGNYVRGEGSSPFETWLASASDYAVKYETETYGEQRPVSFTNWLTTDPLEHPDEPAYFEDYVEVDPNHLKPTENFPSGIFATYHAYPYYPDFMSYQPDYVNYRGYDGKLSNYAGYLNDLKKVHDMPIVIGEFGVPSSRGIAHESVYGMNHGYHSEKEQGEIDSRLFRDIVDQDYAGGFVFSWQDEWFKRSWNTMYYNDPDRRPYWSDVQTCEQHFGILGFDPGLSSTIKIDGKGTEWLDIDYQHALEGDDALYTSYPDGYDRGRMVDDVMMYSDEGYLYIRVDYDDLGDSIRWDDMNTLILLDTIPDQGILDIPFNTGIRSGRGIDFVIQLSGEEDSRVYVDSYYDVHNYRYGVLEGLIENRTYASTKNNGVFHPIDLAMNRGFYIRTLELEVPFESHETGKLRWGNSDPESPDHDSLSDFMGSAKSDMIEIRIPWNLLNFKDPSRKEVMGDLWFGGFDADRFIDSINVGIVTYKPTINGNASGQQGQVNTADSIPPISNGMLEPDEFYEYEYPEWDMPTYHERLKDSYYIMQDTYGDF